jgi:hypothetical protein
MDIIHPTGDESLASFHRPELVALLPGLELALDCWNLLDTNGRGSEKGKYLHKEPAEPQSAYKERLHRSTYTPIFRDSIKAYAGLLSRFQLIDPPSSLEQAEQNIDLQGSSIYSFYNRCDELAIRDGGVYVMVDMPPSQGESNYLDEQRDGRAPYLMVVERKDVINWSVEYVRGRERIRHATIRQIRSMPSENGYGSVIEPVYLVLRPGSVETIRVEKRNGKWTQFSEGVVPTSLPVVPLVWYGASSSRFAQGDLPMNGLAELSIQHYQMQSDLYELLHKCAMPVPVRKGAPVGANGKAAPLVLGPNTAVDLSDNGDFTFAEPTGRSLERHQAELDHVEKLMDRSGLNFLYGANIKTATEASLRASQISSQVNALIRNKTSSFGTVMRLWAAYSGELRSLTRESGLSINDSLINRPIDPSGIAQMINLFNAGLLSRKTVLDELQRGGVLDPDLKVDEEVSRIEEEAPEPTPGPVTENPLSSQ